MARARERMPGFAGVAPHAVAELCRRLDGLPLAIELIAGWVGTLSVQEILTQRAVLLDAEPGSQARGRLVDVVRTSHDLLSPAQQALLPALSVFAGPFTVADAEAVSGLAPLAHLVRGLVDSSWLVVIPGDEHNRFAMLETLRSFAAAKLDEAGDGPRLRRAHAEHFAELAIASEEGMAGPDAAGWTRRLEAALADLDVALAWADEADTDLGLAMSAALWRWWLVSGRLAAGRAWLAAFLARAGQRRDELAGRALCSAAVLAAENGDYAAAIRQGQRALAVFEPLGQREPMAHAATVVGAAHRYLGDRPAARRSFQAAMDLRAAAGDRRGVCVALNNMALLEVDEGDLGRARDLFEQALVIKRQLGEQRSLAIGLANLADVLIRSGQWEAARRTGGEAAELAEGIGNPQLIGTVRCIQGYLAARDRDWETAARHYQAAVAAHQDAGHAHDTVEAMIGLGRAWHRLGRTGDALRQLHAAEALATEIANPRRLAEARVALAEAGETVAPPDGLTARQAEVLGLLATGLSNKQIAGHLCLSPATVERHLATVYRKLGLTGRVEATRYAMAHGLGTPPVL
jgi:non-specific serine/threonine protein kinase